ncbi:NAD(P)/FAD-dependent oxidoreductase [Pseudoroseicyclus aestuarii]|uniref:Glycine/D-amino acid oxidase-like deaminating enzyme n=1 Tax=Pseudoroseicyclus aestuarii TaxID=1795041 RepID=A0A318T4F6_9RHOB|nr:FAD-binding oxidoreductase [Pseudoroseicyclus aestuarii]PYE81408.1 glycine/D-amino acid oxidase-like deaminating enzyme [Pseudoroseicyclus aestuarii]
MKTGIPALEPVEDAGALPPRADVVVIGGGIIGCVAAWELAQRGLSVVLCEKGRIGAEQSSRNWGFVRQMGRDAAEMPLAIESLRIWRGLAEQGIETGFREAGTAWLARTEAEAAGYDKAEALARAHDLPVRVLRGSEVSEVLPGAAPGFARGLWLPSDGRAEPALAAPAFARAAQRQGAVIVQTCAVRGVETAAGRLSAVVTERGVIACEAAVLAGGAWSRLFLRNAAIRFPQLKLLATVARIETAAQLGAASVAAGPVALRPRLDGGYSLARRAWNVVPLVPDSFAFFRDFAPMLGREWRDLKLRVNGASWQEARMPRSWALDAASPFERMRVLDPAPHQPYLRAALKELARAVPAAADARITHGWAGVIDATPDGVPAIGPLAGLPGMTLASGFSGHGFGIGPGAGRLAADLVTGAAPLVDPAPFAPARLGL